ncbi:MAG: S49 family peptidase [Candidatus Aenigmatarchaeota archaeon]
MKHLRYYIYRLLQKIKNNKKLLVIFIFLFLILAFYSYLQGLILEKEKYTFLIVDIDTTISSKNLDIDSLLKELKNPQYFGIILKISSEGGDIEVIRLVNSLKEVNKTKICYIDGLATSAAYWICSLSDYIIARPDSIVGNVGAYTVILDLTGLLKKFGINVTIIKSTPYKDIGSFYRELTDFEKEYLENVLKSLTEKFIEDIKLKRQNINDIAFTGLWFLAEDAKKYGLVDEIGEFERVKRYITEKFNITEDLISFRIKDFKRKKFSILDIFFKLSNSFLYDLLSKKIFI